MQSPKKTVYWETFSPCFPSSFGYWSFRSKDVHTVLEFLVVTWHCANHLINNAKMDIGHVRLIIWWMSITLPGPVLQPIRMRWPQLCLLMFSDLPICVFFQRTPFERFPIPSCKRILDFQTLSEFRKHLPFNQYFVLWSGSLFLSILYVTAWTPAVKSCIGMWNTLIC